MRLSTFSIVACDLAAREWGVAVQSKFLGVGPVVPWAAAEVGAIATQSYANTSYGPRGLELLGSGKGAIDVIKILTEEDEEREKRQVGIVDAQGRSASFTGRECFHWAGHVLGKGYACQGNILAGPDVVKEMARAFEATTGGPLAERLLAALHAGQAAGGDRRGQQSASLHVVKERGGYGGFTDRLIDLRVDEHAAPIDELSRIYRLHQLYFGLSRELVKLSTAEIREIQGMLRDFGLYRGDLTGLLGGDTEIALKNFHNVENLEMRWQEERGMLDAAVLQFMRDKHLANR